MGIGNVACQDLVDMLGCAADMSLVSTALPNGTNISTICPVSCDSCPETVCEDQGAIQYFDDCETMIDCKCSSSFCVFFSHKTEALHRLRRL